MNKKMAIFTAMGFEAFGLIVAFVLIGKWCDENFGWKGMGVSFGGIFAIFAWVAHVLFMVKQLAKEQESSHTDST